MSDKDKQKVLFLCRDNACRSQMAEGFLRSIAPAEFDAYSAGSNETFVHPLAIEVMREVGIDISGQRSKSVSEFAGWEFDFVITVCGDSAEDTCPVFMGGARRRLAWSFDDPAVVTGSDSDVLEAFRRIRDQIEASISRFIVERS